MSRSPHRLNRILLAVVGLVLVAVAIYGLARSFGAFGSERAEQPLITTDLVDWLDDNSAWVWALVGGAGAVVAILALRWLLAQLHRRPPAIDWTVPQDGGTTTIAGDGVASAIEADLLQLRPVEWADVRFTGSQREPALDVRLGVHDDVRATELADEVRTFAVARACQALELDQLATTVALELMAPTRRLA